MKPVSPLSWFTRFTQGLRFPQLFLLTAVVFLADLAVPDIIPFVDEVLLGLVTTMFGLLRRKSAPPSEEQ